MIHLSDSIKHYKKPEIQRAIAEHAANKEVGVRFNDKFGKRPDVLQYPGEVLDFAKKGTTSFHCSEELWNNPLNLEPGMNQRQLDELRIGWDLVLDIDCKFIDYSKIAAEHILNTLSQHDIKSASIKFSGNNGFHIGIPYEAFPTHITGKATNLLFPQVAKRVAAYIKQKTAPSIAKPILKLADGKFNQIAEKTKADISQLYVKDREGKPKKDDDHKVILDPSPFLDIDTVLISSRHLYRMPYSLHEKSGLASIPLMPEEISQFKKENANPNKVTVTEDLKFMDRNKARPNEAKKLVSEALDATATERTPQPTTEKEYEIPSEAIPEKFFPECILKLLQGVEEGRKRTLFILINFLSSCSWSYEAINARIKDWNQKNKEPLRETYLLGQLRYAKQRKKRIPPPNCDNTAYYKDLRVKCDEKTCSKVKNPVVYTRKKAKI